jgi:dienelactone hydrolase
MRRLGLLCVMALAAACSNEAPEPGTAMTPSGGGPAVETREVTYEQNGTTLQGLLAWDDGVTEPRPGVLVVHEWWGHDEHVRNQARRLAENGYVAFALDMYGDGKVAEHPEDAQRFMEEAMSDPAAMRARFEAAREVLSTDPHVDADAIAAIGYCFGGGVVLDMARAGADLDAVVTFHGMLGTETPAAAGEIQPRILVLHGGDDEFVPPAQVGAFREEMTSAGASFGVVTYPGAKHGFTNPDAADHGMPQLAYDEAAAEQAWQAMLALFSEVFGAG